MAVGFLDRVHDYLIKVGPKGYIHGWIFVGAPGIGDIIHHSGPGIRPGHGKGTVTHVDDHGHVHVDFGNGKHRSFEHVAGDGPSRFGRRKDLGGGDKLTGHMNAARAARRRQDFTAAAEHHNAAAEATTHPTIAADMRARAANDASRAVPASDRVTVAKPREIPTSPHEEHMAAAAEAEHRGDRPAALRHLTQASVTAPDRDTQRDIDDRRRELSEQVLHSTTPADSHLAERGLRATNPGDLKVGDVYSPTPAGDLRTVTGVNRTGGVIEVHHGGYTDPVGGSTSTTHMPSRQVYRRAANRGPLGDVSNAPTPVPTSSHEEHVQAANDALARGDRAAALRHLTAAGNLAPDKDTRAGIAAQRRDVHAEMFPPAKIPAAQDNGPQPVNPSDLNIGDTYSTSQTGIHRPVAGIDRHPGGFVDVHHDNTGDLYSVHGPDQPVYRHTEGKAPGVPTTLGTSAAAPDANPNAPKPEQIRPSGTAATDLKNGDYARLTGTDQYGQTTHLEGYVTNPTPYRVGPKRGKKKDMLGFEVTETPSGANGWRGQVFVAPTALTDKPRLGSSDDGGLPDSTGWVPLGKPDNPAVAHERAPEVSQPASPLRTAREPLPNAEPVRGSDDEQKAARDINRARDRIYNAQEAGDKAAEAKHRAKYDEAKARHTEANAATRADAETRRTDDLKHQRTEGEAERAVMAGNHTEAASKYRELAQSIRDDNGGYHVYRNTSATNGRQWRVEHPDPHERVSDGIFVEFKNRESAERAAGAKAERRAKEAERLATINDHAAATGNGEAARLRVTGNRKIGMVDMYTAERNGRDSHPIPGAMTDEELKNAIDASDMVLMNRNPTDRKLNDTVRGHLDAEAASRGLAAHEVTQRLSAESAARRAAEKPEIPGRTPEVSEPGGHPLAAAIAHDHEAQEHRMTAATLRMRAAKLNGKTDPTGVKRDAANVQAEHHQTAARTASDAAQAIRRSATNPDHQRTLGQLDQDADKALKEGRNHDAARIYGSMADRMRAGEKDSALDRGYSSGWKVTGTGGGNDHGSRKDAEAAQATHEAQTLASRERMAKDYAAKDTAVKPYNQAQQDAVAIAQRRSGNPYLHIGPHEKLTADEFHGLTAEHREDVQAHVGRLAKDNPGEIADRAAAVTARWNGATPLPSPPDTKPAAPTSPHEEHLAAAEQALADGNKAKAINHLMAAANSAPDRATGDRLRSRQMALAAEMMGKPAPGGAKTSYDDLLTIPRDRVADRVSGMSNEEIWAGLRSNRSRGALAGARNRIAGDALRAESKKRGIGLTPPKEDRPADNRYMDAATGRDTGSAAVGRITTARIQPGDKIHVETRDGELSSTQRKKADVATVHRIEPATTAAANTQSYGVDIHTDQGVIRNQVAHQTFGYHSLAGSTPAADAPGVSAPAAPPVPASSSVTNAQREALDIVRRSGEDPRMRVGSFRGAGRPQLQALERQGLVRVKDGRDPSLDGQNPVGSYEITDAGHRVLGTTPKPPGPPTSRHEEHMAAGNAARAAGKEGIASNQFRLAAVHAENRTERENARAASDRRPAPSAVADPAMQGMRFDDSGIQSRPNGVEGGAANLAAAREAAADGRMSDAGSHYNAAIGAAADDKTRADIRAEHVEAAGREHDRQGRLAQEETDRRALLASHEAARLAANVPAGPMDRFSPQEQATIRNAVADHAAQHYGGPFNMGRSDAARYTSEGPLKDLTNKHDLKSVWQAVDHVIGEDPSVLNRSETERAAGKAERAGRAEAKAKEALAAFQGNDLDRASRLLDEGESIEPKHHYGAAGVSPGRSWDQMRAAVARRRDANNASQSAVMTDAERDAAIGRVFDDAPHIDTHAPKQAGEAAAQAEGTSMPTWVGVGDEHAKSFRAARMETARNAAQLSTARDNEKLMVDHVHRVANDPARSVHDRQAAKDLLGTSTLAENERKTADAVAAHAATEHDAQMMAASDRLTGYQEETRRLTEELNADRAAGRKLSPVEARERSSRIVAEERGRQADELERMAAQAEHPDAKAALTARAQSMRGQAKERRYEHTAEHAAMVREQPAKPAAPTGFIDRVRQDRPNRAIVAEHAGMTRAQFDALPESEKTRILGELKHVADSGDTQTIPSNRTSMGTTIRGATADHVTTARSLRDRFTRVAPPTRDDSAAGVVGRLRDAESVSAARSELYSRSMAELEDIASAGGYSGTASGVTKKKLVDRLANAAFLDAESRRSGVDHPHVVDASMSAAQRAADRGSKYEPGRHLDEAMANARNASDRKRITALRKELDNPAPKADGRNIAPAATAPKPPGNGLPTPPKVDIHNDPGINFRAAPTLDLAEQHGVRADVESLLPYTVNGPDYNRGVHEDLRRALDSMRKNEPETTRHWLDEAKRNITGAPRPVDPQVAEERRQRAEAEAKRVAAEAETAADKADQAATVDRLKSKLDPGFTMDSSKAEKDARAEARREAQVPTGDELRQQPAHVQQSAKNLQLSSGKVAEHEHKIKALQHQMDVISAELKSGQMRPATRAHLEKTHASGERMIQDHMDKLDEALQDQARRRSSWEHVRPVDLGKHTDAQLEDRFHRLSTADDPGEVAGKLGDVLDEMGRRETAASDVQNRIDAATAKGVPYRDAYADAHGLDPNALDKQERAALVDSARRAGETREQTVRRMYAEHVHLQHLAAEAATNGHLLKPESKTFRDSHGKTIVREPISVFSGPVEQARLHASEDLQRWWQDHPRMTYSQFRAEMLGDASDRRAAAQSRLAGNGRDFGV